MTGPALEARVRTLAYYQLRSGKTLLINSDGTSARQIDFADPGGSEVPLAVSRNGSVIALAMGNSVIISTLDRPNEIDTVLSPAPDQMTPAAFSPDQRYLALVSFAPAAALLLYDRANRTVDTLPFGSVTPALAPVFSPNSRRVAMIAANDLTLFATIVELDDNNRTHTSRLGISRFENRPILGWPTWNELGLLGVFVRVTPDAPDTLALMSLDPDNLQGFAQDVFTAALVVPGRPDEEIAFGLRSTYSISPDGQAVVIGAAPDGDLSRHAIYFGSSDSERVQVVVNQQDQFPMFPLLIN